MIVGTVGSLKARLDSTDHIFYVKAFLTPAGALTLTTNARVLSSTLATALGQVVRWSVFFLLYYFVFKIFFNVKFVLVLWLKDFTK